MTRKTVKNDRQPQKTPKRYSMVTYNDQVKTWLDAQDNRSASIDLLVRLFIANTGEANSDLYDTLIESAKGIFGGFVPDNPEGPTLSISPAQASASVPVDDPEATSAKSDDPSPAESKDDENVEEKKPKRKSAKRVKPATDKINGLDYFKGK